MKWGSEALPTARFSLVTGVAKTQCANFYMPENIGDCVLAGAELTGKINLDLFLFFLNCLRAVLAVAEAVCYPRERVPPNPGCQWRARPWRELPLATPNAWKEDAYQD